MSAPTIYKELGQTYVADCCVPLVRAASQGQLSLRAWTQGHYPGRKLPSHALPGVMTVGVWDAAHAQDWGLDWHRNEGIELTLLEKGRLPFSVDGSEYLLQPGDLTITRPWQRHRVGNPLVTAGRLHWLILDVGVRRPHQSWTWPPWLVLNASDVQQLTHLLRHHEQPVWHAPEELQDCFRRIAHRLEDDVSSEAISWITLHLNELMLRLIALLQGSPLELNASLSSSLHTVDLFLADLAAHHEHLAQEWTLGRMAAVCGLGVTRFVHHCTQLTNLSPVQYLNACRLEFAKTLLAEHPPRSITEVARLCGFSSSQYFATVFGRHFGCSPSRYRESPRQHGGVQAGGTCQ